MVHHVRGFLIALVLVLLVAPFPGMGTDEALQETASGLQTLAHEAPVEWGPGDPIPGVPRPEAETGIGPGTKLWIERPNHATFCTANFLWENRSGALYIGTAGHCLMPSDVSATHGEDAEFDPSSVRVHSLVDACPSSCHFQSEDVSWVELGPVAYARKGIGFDFALIALPADLHDHIRFDMPVWGGPDGDALLEPGETVLHYGYGSVYGSNPETRARVGVGLEPVDVSPLFGDVFAYLGTVSGGDSGSAVVVGREDAGGPTYGGAQAIGLVTHTTSPTYAGAVFGTRVDMAQELVARDLCEEIRVLPGGSFRDPPAPDCEVQPAPPGETEEPEQPGVIPTVRLEEEDHIGFTVTGGSVHEIRLVAEHPFELTRWTTTFAGSSGAVGDTFFALYPVGAFEDSATACGGLPADWAWGLQGFTSGVPDGERHHPPGEYTLLAAAVTPAAFTFSLNHEPQLQDPPREVDVGISFKEIEFPKPTAFPRSEPTPATLSFDHLLDLPTTGILVTKFLASPRMGSAGHFKTGQTLTDGEEDLCGEKWAEGVGYSSPTGGSGNFGDNRETSLSLLLPAAQDYHWSGSFNATAGLWTGESDEVRLQTALVTMPKEEPPPQLVAWFTHDCIVTACAFETDPSPAPIVQYDWDFGDGTQVSGSDANVQHEYEVAGTYLVELTVHDENGAWDMARRLVSTPGALHFTARPDESPLLNPTYVLSDEAPSGQEPSKAYLGGSYLVGNHPTNFDYVVEDDFSLQGDAQVSLALSCDFPSIGRPETSISVRLLRNGEGFASASGGPLYWTCQAGEVVDLNLAIHDAVATFEPGDRFRLQLSVLALNTHPVEPNLHLLVESSEHETRIEAVGFPGPIRATP